MILPLCCSKYCHLGHSAQESLTRVYLIQTDNTCQEVKSKWMEKIPRRMAVLQLILYMRIEGAGVWGWWMKFIAGRLGRWEKAEEEISERGHRVKGRGTHRWVWGSQHLQRVEVVGGQQGNSEGFCVVGVPCRVWKKGIPLTFQRSIVILDANKTIGSPKGKTGCCQGSYRLRTLLLPRLSFIEEFNFQTTLGGYFRSQSL